LQAPLSPRQYPSAKHLVVESVDLSHTAASLAPPSVPVVDNFDLPHTVALLAPPPVPVVDTFDLPHTAALLASPPLPAASEEEKLEFLHQQLDSIGSEKAILSGLVLLGSSQHQRIQGGALSPAI
jgi:hypothetical protein